jgi:hypothetical protein
MKLYLSAASGGGAGSGGGSHAGGGGGTGSGGRGAAGGGGGAGSRGRAGSGGRTGSSSGGGAGSRRSAGSGASSRTRGHSLSLTALAVMTTMGFCHFIYIPHKKIFLEKNSRIFIFLNTIAPSPNFTKQYWLMANTFYPPFECYTNS